MTVQVRGAELVVVGAGPAGLAAAAAAAQAGCQVTLLDAGPRPGGQFWRHRPGDDGRGHKGWKTFQGLLGALSDVDYRPEHAVYFAEPDGTVHTRQGAWRGERTVIATGAYDRAVPFAGWELAGVVTPGGAQALLKGQGVPIGSRVVVAGAGPFLLPVATGLARAGVEIAAVVEAASIFGYRAHLPEIAALPGKLGEALGYAAQLARRRIPYLTRQAVVAAHGGSAVEAVTVADLRTGRRRRIECDAVAVGYGFTPQIELAVALGCETALDGDRSLVVSVDRGQSTSVPGVLAAGEVTGVGGADLALVEGRLAGLTAAAALGRPVGGSQVERLEALVRRRERLRGFAAVLAGVHGIPGEWRLWSTSDSELCRCERVPVSAVSQAIGELDIVDARGAKLMTRAGMGRCQGRVCGFATACLTAAALGREVTAADLAAFAARPIAQPVTLSDLAGDLLEDRQISG